MHSICQASLSVGTMLTLILIYYRPVSSYDYGVEVCRLHQERKIGGFASINKSHVICRRRWHLLFLLQHTGAYIYS